MTGREILPGFIVIDNDDSAEIIATQDATLADIKAALRATDSRRDARNLRTLLRACDGRLSGDTRVGQILDDTDWNSPSFADGEDS